MLSSMQFLSIALAIALVSGCGKDQPAPPAPPPAEGIELVSPGAEPRRELRYRLARGATTLDELSLEVDIDAGGQGGTLPTLILRTELATQDVLADGSMTVKRTILDVEARDRPGGAIQAAQMTEQLQLMKGLTLIGTISPRGKPSGVHVDAAGQQLPPAIGAQLDSLIRSFEQVTMPLPAEPVGIGASWRHRKPVDQYGIKMQTLTTIVLTAIDGDRLTFTSTTRVEGADQAVTQGGTTIEVTGIGGVGAGGGSMDLSRMAMTGELTAELTSEMRSGGETARMRMKMTTRITPASAEPAPAPAPAPAPGAAAAAPVPDREPDPDQGAHSAP